MTATAAARCSFHAMLLITVLLLPAGFADAQTASAPIDLRLDAATTSIHWTLGATAHTVHGSFQLKSGVIRVDPASGNASGLIVIDATTGQSGDKARDRRMHKDVLESDRYPEITFRPSRISRPGGALELTEAGPLTLEGVLMLHGQEHPLSLALNFHPSGGALAAETQFDIPYVAWGMKDPSTFILRVEKQVHLTVEASAAPH
jgi:polyisoprenoid-binding protein YceI